MTTDDAKSYLANRQIPRLFESLMTGLMYHRPSDHISYLIECLQKVKDKGDQNISWHAFVDLRHTKTPLPPITPPDGKRPRSRPGSKARSREPSRIESPKPLEEKKGSPLPPIAVKSDTIPDVPIVLVMGGPGCGKRTQIHMLQEKHKKWVYLAMGDLLRQEVSKHTSNGAPDDKWDIVSDLLTKGELIPEGIACNLLIDHLKSNAQAEGFILEGFPNNMDQLEQYDKLIGRVDMAFMLDSQEETCKQKLKERLKLAGREEDMNGITHKLNVFKQHCLPAAKRLDDRSKLIVINGDRSDSEVADELADMFKKSVFGDENGKKFVPTAGNIKTAASPSSLPPAVSYTRPADDMDKPKDEAPSSVAAMFKEAVSEIVMGPPDIQNKDEGRVEGLPKCPIIVVAGGPGSGKGTQAQKLVSHFQGTVHISMGDIIRTEIGNKGTADEKWGMIASLVSEGDMAPEDVAVELLVEQLKKHADAAAFFIEGYPRDKTQLEDFNKQIGGLDFTVLFDCEEYYMKQRLLDRGKEKGRIDDNENAITKRLAFYKQNTLPVYKYLDDQGKLVVLNGDRDEQEIFYDLTTVLNKAFFGKDPGQQEEVGVVEEMMVQETAAITGGDNGNTDYTKELEQNAAEAQKEGVVDEMTKEEAPQVQQEDEEVVTTGEEITTQDETDNTQQEVENKQDETDNTQQEVESKQDETDNTQQEVENKQDETDNTQQEVENKQDETQDSQAGQEVSQTEAGDVQNETEQQVEGGQETTGKEDGQETTGKEEGQEKTETQEALQNNEDQEVSQSNTGEVTTSQGDAGNAEGEEITTQDEKVPEEQVQQ